LLDHQFAILAASVEFTRRFGATEVNLSGKRLADLGSGWRHASVADRLGLLMRGEPCPPFRVQGSLGAPLSADVLVHPRRLRAEHGGPRYLLLLQDLTTPVPLAGDAG
jgi:hypothetical protein